MPVVSVCQEHVYLKKQQKQKNTHTHKKEEKERKKKDIASLIKQRVCHVNVQELIKESAKWRRERSTTVVDECGV